MLKNAQKMGKERKLIKAAEPPERNLIRLNVFIRTLFICFIIMHV